MRRKRMVDESIYMEPPHDEEAERVVLGACLLDKNALDFALDVLKPEDFYIPVYAQTFKIFSEMVQENIAVDLLTFQDAMKERNVFNQMGGQPLMAQITQNPWFITATNIGHYTDIVLDKARRRKAIFAALRMYQSASDPMKGIEDIIEEAEQEFFNLNQARIQNVVYSADVVAQEACEEIRQEIDQIKEGGLFGVSTGFADLDLMLDGLKPGSFNILAARPSMGKTSLALNIAMFARSQGEVVRTMIVSLETPRTELMKHMWASDVEIPLDSIKRGVASKAEKTKFAETVAAFCTRVKAEELYFIDTPALTVPQLRTRCRQFKMRYKNLGLLIIDYLQLLDSGMRNKQENQVYEVTKISRSLKSLAMELECPILCLSQLSRESEKRSDKKPQLSDLRDSGAIEQDADTVMLLYRDDYYAPPDSTNASSQAELRIAKNRNGATGVVKLTFQRDIFRFYA